MIEIVYLLIGFVFGGAAIWLTSVKTLQNNLKTNANTLDIIKEDLETKKNDGYTLLNENSVLQERIRNMIQKSESELLQEKKSNQDKLNMLEKNKEQMKLEFKDLADKILQTNSEKFSMQNQENLNKMINPIKEQFTAFKKQIDDVYVQEAKDRSTLQAEIKSIKEINHQMSADAKKLTNALKGESKTQGIWGEMILERVLENSGLREGEEYEREVSLEHESDGSRYRPDVIVHLPDSREIIIDAKTSLTAYERYASENEENLKENFAKEHLNSIKKHIKELSQKDYTNLKGIKSLDFIFMFVPVESALLMALEYDSSLFDWAFKQNVILVGPTTLMVSLRAVENTWKYEHQQRNALEIAKRAGLLYDKFVGFVESVEKLGKQLGTAQKTYDDAYSKLHTGAGSVTSQFQKLEKLGAAASKKLPEHILRAIED
ncbi:MAG: DNA recombination protein RmuC [Sulfurimonas sp.]|nr:MAG: DNA recombination protein RmuC [Sulfurimonas sp.]